MPALRYSRIILIRSVSLLGLHPGLHPPMTALSQITMLGTYRAKAHAVWRHISQEENAYEAEL